MTGGIRSPPGLMPQKVSCVHPKVASGRDCANPRVRIGSIADINDLRTQRLLISRLRKLVTLRAHSRFGLQTTASPRETNAIRSANRSSSLMIRGTLF